MCVNSAFITFTVDPCVSVDENVSGLKEMNAYSNPIEGKFRIIFSFTEEKRIQISNSLAQAIQESISSTSYKDVDLSYSDKGIYFVKILTSKGNYKRKIIVN